MRHTSVDSETAARPRRYEIFTLLDANESHVAGRTFFSTRLATWPTDFADGSRPLQLSFGVDHHYPSRVVTTIFKPAQTFQQKAARFRGSDRSDNAAHKFVCSLGKLRKGYEPG